MTHLMEEFNAAHELIGPNPALMTAVKCIRAEGIKTAILTNNWENGNQDTFIPVDLSLFDVVSGLSLFCCFQTLT